MTGRMFAGGEGSATRGRAKFPRRVQEKQAAASFPSSTLHPPLRALPLLQTNDKKYLNNTV